LAKICACLIGVTHSVRFRFGGLGFGVGLVGVGDVGRGCWGWCFKVATGTLMGLINEVLTSVFDSGDDGVVDAGEGAECVEGVFVNQRGEEPKVAAVAE